jgi:hypothetical protein
MTALTRVRLPLFKDYVNLRILPIANPQHEGTHPVTSVRRAPEMRVSLSSRRTSLLVFDRTQNN